MRATRPTSHATTRGTPAIAGRESVLGSMAVALVAFVVYAALCPPVSGMGDGSEFTLVLATNGVAHPTGYPLYTLFGHAFGTLLHAFGVSWPLATNLWSAVGAAIAVGFLFALASRLTRTVVDADAATRFLAALIPVALFAFQPILLLDASAGEVNSWSAAWACLAGYTFVCLQGALESGAGGAPERDRRGALIWGLVCGAGLAHHLTSVMVFAPLTIALVATLARRHRAVMPLLLAAALAACVPVAGYGIIAWRAWHPAVVQWPWLAPGLASVRDHITGEQYRQFIGYFAPAEEQRALIDHIALPFLGVGLVALLAGLLRARDAGTRAIWAALTTATVLVVAFTFRYGVPDPAPYFVPAMAFGAAAVAPALASLAAPRVGGTALRLGVAALAVLALVVPWVRAAATRQHEIDGFERLIRSMWSAVPPDTAIVFWPDDRYIRLLEYQILRGEKPALLVLCPDLLLEDQTRERMRQRFGVDPLEGHPIPSIAPGSPDADQRIRRYFKQVIRSLNERIRPPVIMFDPSVPMVQQQRKPWESAGFQGNPAMLPGHPPER